MYISLSHPFRQKVLAIMLVMLIGAPGALLAEEATVADSAPPPDIGLPPADPSPAPPVAPPAPDTSPAPLAETPEATPPPEALPPPAEPPPAEVPPPPPAAPDAGAGSPDAASVAPEIPIATSTPGTGQDTANPQTTIGGSDLLATTDPSEATTTDGELGIVNQESGNGEQSSEQGTVSSEQVSEQESVNGEQAIADGEQPPQPPTPTPAVSPAPQPPPESPQPIESGVVATLSREALKPKPEYTLGVVGTVIAARAKPRWQGESESKGKEKDDQATVVSASPAIAANRENGTLAISGSCRLSYFSVILYRRPDDYDRDPASYIVNKAFPCENGSYSYVLADLPKNLAPGTYYLLVAEQGDSGPWRPISGVIPVTIAPHP